MRCMLIVPLRSLIWALRLIRCMLWKSDVLGMGLLRVKRAVRKSLLQPWLMLGRMSSIVLCDVIS